MITPLYSKLLVFLLALTISENLSAQTKLQPQPAVYNQKLQPATLLFMENKGQVTDTKGNLRPDILFMANSGGAKIYLSSNAICYQSTKTEYPNGYNPFSKEPAKNLEKEEALKKQIKTSTHRFTIALQDANQHPNVVKQEQSSYFENYYLAQCPNGITGVHGYEKIIYKNVYPNIDWIIYSKGGFMEYDFLVHPGGDAAAIKLKIKDADSVSINEAGEVVMKTSLGEVREKAPVSYANGTVVESHFKKLEDGMIGFDVQSQQGKELRIDPSIVWATYYGGSGFEGDFGVCATDANGNVYLTGNTNSINAIASGGYQNSFGGNNDAYLVKFNNNGNRLWATYYGGTGSDVGSSCAADGNDNIYMAGNTSSVNAISASGFQNNLGGNNDAFIVKFTSSGVRIWGSYYGGLEGEQNINCCLDGNNNVYLSGTTGSSNGIASGGFQNTISGIGTLLYDAFLVKFNSNGNRIWGTYYGGNYSEFCYSSSTDISGNIYLCGYTNSETGIAAGGFQNTLVNGFLGRDAFLVKFDGTGNRLWATYYGGNGSDEGLACATDMLGNVYLAGSTSSTDVIASNGFQMTFSGGYFDGFLVKFNSNGNRQWGTYFGGSGADFITACSVNTNGDIYATGTTQSATNIASGGFQNIYQGGQDVLISKLSSSGNLLWASYYGGSSRDNAISCAVDGLGNVFVSGYTNSVSGIAFNGFQNSIGGDYDAFLAKIGIACIDPTLPIVSATQNVICSGTSAILHVSSGNLNNAAYWQWREDSCNGTSVDTGISITVAPSMTTTYYVRGESGCIMPGLCASVIISVKPGPITSFSISDSVGCGKLPVSFSNATQNATTLQWSFGDGATTTDSLPQPHVFLPGNYTVSLKAENGICSSMISKTIRVVRSPVAAFSVAPNINIPTQLSGAHFQFTNASQNASLYLWKFSNSDSSSLQNLLHTFTATGNYYVQLYAYNSSGCTDSVTLGPIIIIDNIPLQIPTAFSPNNDGINDTWVINGLQSDAQSNVSIFNRWGQSVFNSTGYNKPWDGNYNGKPIPVDTYYYIITANDKSFTGSVFLLR